jgi:hypothetical protein
MGKDQGPDCWKKKIKIQYQLRLPVPIDITFYTCNYQDDISSAQASYLYRQY